MEDEGGENGRERRPAKKEEEIRRRIVHKGTRDATSRPLMAACYQPHDSLAGPSLNLLPEELDRLDASHLEGTDGEAPTIHVDTIAMDHLEASINATLEALRHGQIPQPRVEQRAEYAARKDGSAGSGGSGGAGGNPFFPKQQIDNNIKATMLTPPASSEKIPSQRSFIERIRNESDKAISEMQRLCDERVEMVQRTEQEKCRTLEAQYRQQLGKVQQDLENMLSQQEHVLRLKNEVENGLQMELDAARRDLRREQEQRRAERERHEETIRALQNKAAELGRRLTACLKEASLASHSRPAERGRNREPEKGKNDDDYALSRERKVAELQRKHDAKIASLVKQFEQEKAAALNILKTRIKAELNLLVPRVREQCQRAYDAQLVKVKEQMMASLRRQHDVQMRKLREEHAVEIRLMQRQLREQLESERVQVANKLKTKYELKIMDVRNECERRILERLRRTNQSDYYISSPESDDSLVL